MTEGRSDRDRYGHCAICCTPFQQANRTLDLHQLDVYGRSEWPMLCGGSAWGNTR